MHVKLWYKGSIHQRFSLCQQRGKRKQISISCRNANEFFQLKIIWHGTQDYGNVFCGKMSAHFSLFWGKLDLIYIAKTRKNPWSRLLPKKGAKTNLCDKWACISVHVMGDLWRHYWCRGLHRNFGATYALFLATPCVFQQASFCTNYNRLASQTKSVKKQWMWPNGKLACPNFFWNVLQASVFKCVSWNILFTPLPVN